MTVGRLDVEPQTAIPARRGWTWVRRSASLQGVMTSDSIRSSVTVRGALGGGSMDVARPDLARKKKIRQGAYGSSRPWSSC